MWVVVLLHATWGALVILWPFLVAREWDAIFIILIAAVLLHWIVFRGECIISLLEKRLLYVDYRMGDAPLRQWYNDVFPAGVATVINVLAWTGMFCGVNSVVWRNVSLTAHSIRLEFVWPPGGPLDHP